MEVIFKNPGFNYSLDSIMLFHNNKWNEMWSNSLFQVYNQIECEKLYSLPVLQRRLYLNDALLPFYLEQESEFADKIIKYNSHWQQHKGQITEAFSEAFQLDYADKLNNIVGNITLNPIEPRFLDSHTFDVFHLNSERGALGVALHEVIHFAWFDVWQAHLRTIPLNMKHHISNGFLVKWLWILLCVKMSVCMELIPIFPMNMYMVIFKL